jgi:tRNAmet cytidine acetate ligase
MKVVGLIVEYNPFHNGHQYHLDEAKKTNRR